MVFCVHSSHFLASFKFTLVKQSDLAFPSGLPLIIQRIIRKTPLCSVQMTLSFWSAQLEKMILIILLQKHVFWCQAENKANAKISFLIACWFGQRQKNQEENKQALERTAMCHFTRFICQLLVYCPYHWFFLSRFCHLQSALTPGQWGRKKWELCLLPCWSQCRRGQQGTSLLGKAPDTKGILSQMWFTETYAETSLKDRLEFGYMSWCIWSILECVPFD